MSETTGIPQYARDTVLTIEQVADALQVTPRTVERKDVPCFYIGPRKRRYVWGDVLDWLRQREGWRIAS